MRIILIIGNYLESEAYKLLPQPLVLHRTLTHPDAELHPQKHVELVDRLVKGDEHVLIESYSEYIFWALLKAVADGRLSEDDLDIIFVDESTDTSSTAKRIFFTKHGLLSDSNPLPYCDWFAIRDELLTRPEPQMALFE